MIRLQPWKYFGSRLVPYITVAMGLYLFQSAWAALLGYHAGMLLVFATPKTWRRKTNFKPAGSLWWAIIFSILSFLAGGWVYWQWPHILDPAFTSGYLASLGLDTVTWPWFIVYFTIVNPLLEEFYWRDFLGNQSRYPASDDMWFSAYHLLILFPFLKWNWMLIAVVIITSAAWGWRQAVRRTGSLLAPAIAHSIADFSILTAAFLRSAH